MSFISCVGKVLPTMSHVKECVRQVNVIDAVVAVRCQTFFSELGAAHTHRVNDLGAFRHQRYSVQLKPLANYPLRHRAKPSP